VYPVKGNADGSFRGNDLPLGIFSLLENIFQHRTLRSDRTCQCRINLLGMKPRGDNQKKKYADDFNSYHRKMFNV
jgi:hypothetical protein